MVTKCGTGNDTIYLGDTGSYNGNLHLGAGSNTITANGGEGTYSLYDASLSDITVLNTADTGSFTYVLDADNVSNIDSIVFNDNAPATLKLQSGTYDFSGTGTSLTFGHSGSTLDLDTNNSGNTSVTLTGEEVENLANIYGQSDGPSTALTFVDSADLSGKTVTYVDTVNINDGAGSALTLTLDLAGFSTTNYLFVNGATGVAAPGNELDLIDAGTNVNLRNTEIRNFSTIVANTNYTLTVDALTIADTQTVSWQSNKYTAFDFTQTYDASNWTLTDGCFGDITLGSAITLTVSDTFLSDTIAFQVGSGDKLIINNVGDNGLGNPRDYVATVGTTNYGAMYINAANSGAYVDLEFTSGNGASQWFLTGGNGDDHFIGSSYGGYESTVFSFQAGQLTAGDTVTGGGYSDQNVIYLSTNAVYNSDPSLNLALADSAFDNVHNVYTLATIDNFFGNTSPGYSSNSIELGANASNAGIYQLDARLTHNGDINLTGGMGHWLDVQLSSLTSDFRADGSGTSYADAYTSDLNVYVNGSEPNFNGLYIGTGSGNDYVYANAGGENIHTGVGNDEIQFAYNAFDNLASTTVDGGTGTSDTLTLDTSSGTSSTYGHDVYDSYFTHMSHLDVLNLLTTGGGQWVQLGAHASDAFAAGLTLEVGALDELQIFATDNCTGQGDFTSNLTAGGTSDNRAVGSNNNILDETIWSGSGNDMIYGAREYSYLNAGSGADTVSLDSNWSGFYGNYANQIYQDEFASVTADLIGTSTGIIGNDFTISFAEGVDVINNFRAGIGGNNPSWGNWGVSNIDILWTDMYTGSNTANLRFALGENSAGLDHSGILSGNWDGTTFTVTADNSGSATLVIQTGGTGNNALSTNQSMVILAGVNALDLTNWNFGGVGLVANYNGSTYSVFGVSADPVVIDTTLLDPHNVISGGAVYTGSHYDRGAVTVIDVSGVYADAHSGDYGNWSSHGAQLFLDGTVTTHLNDVYGTNGNDTFVFANATMGADSLNGGFYLDGWGGTNTIVFTHLNGGTTTIGDYWSDANYRIDQINEIDLTHGTGDSGPGSLVLDNYDGGHGGLANIVVKNISETQGATVDLGDTWCASFRVGNVTDTSDNYVTLGNVTESVFAGAGNDTVTFNGTSNTNWDTNSYWGTYALHGGDNTVVLNDGASITQNNITVSGSGTWAIQVDSGATVAVGGYQLQELVSSISGIGGGSHYVQVQTGGGNSLVGYDLAASIDHWYVGVQRDGSGMGSALGYGDNSVVLQTLTNTAGDANAQSVYMDGGDSFHNSIDVESFVTNGTFNFGNTSGTIIADDGADISGSTVTTDIAAGSTGTWSLQFGQADAGVTISATEFGTVDGYVANPDNLDGNTVTVDTAIGGSIEGTLNGNVVYWNIGTTGALVDYADAGSNSVSLGDPGQFVNFGGGNNELDVGDYTTQGDFYMGSGTNNYITVADGANIANSGITTGVDGSWYLNIHGNNATVTVSSDELQLLDEYTPASNIVGGTGETLYVNTGAGFGGALQGGPGEYVLDTSVQNWHIGVDSVGGSLGFGDNTVGMTSMPGGNNQNVYFGEGADTLNLNAAGSYTGNLNLGTGANILATDYSVNISGAASLVNAQTVTVGGSNRTLTVSEDQFTTSDLTSLTGSGNSNLVVLNGTVGSLDLTHTAITGFASIDVSDLGTETVTVDAASVNHLQAVTWYGDATKIDFTASYDASLWTLTANEFTDITIDTGAYLTADQSLLSSTITFRISTASGLTLNDVTSYTATSNTVNYGTAEVHLATGNASVNVSAAVDNGSAHGWSITGNTGNDQMTGSQANDTITDTLGGDNYFAGMDGADVITTSGLGVDTFYQTTSNSVQATDTLLSKTVVVGNTLTFGDGLDIINGFNATKDVISVDHNSGTPTQVLGTQWGSGKAFGTSLYAVEGNYVDGIFTVAALGTGNATIVIEGNNDTFTNNQSMILLVGVQEGQLHSSNFIGH